MRKALFTTLCLTLVVSTLPLGLTTAYGKTIHAGTVNWPPYYGESLKNGGFMTEVTKAAFKKAGWDYDLQFMNWNRAVGLCKRGKLDMVQGAYYSKKRSKNFLFTDKYASAQVVIFKKKGSDITYNNLEDLKPYTLGILRGWAYPDKFTAAKYLHTEMADKPIANIQKLLKGRVDLIVGEKLVMVDIARSKLSQQADELIALDPPLQKNNLYNMITKKRDDSAQIVKDFNKGLQMIKDDGTYDRIMQEHGF